MARVIRVFLAVLAVLGSMLGAMALGARPAAATGTPTFDINDVSVLEGNGPGSSSVITFTVTLSNAVQGQNYTAMWKTSPVTASEAPSGSHCDGTKDYIQQLPSALATMNTAFPSEQISVTTCADNVKEPDETFNVILFNPISGSQIGKGTGVGTFLDDDNAPSVTIPNFSVSEPSAQKTVTVPVDVSSASSSAITFNWATAAGTATAGTTCGGSVDYLTVTNGQVHVPANSTAPDVPLQVTICPNASITSSKSFKLHFTNYSANVTGQTTDATVTITVPSSGNGLVVEDPSPVQENAASVTFKIQLIGNPTMKSTISYQTFDNGGGAKGSFSGCGTGIDYVQRSDTVVLFAGHTSVTVTVQLCNDTLDENDEGFDLVIKSATGYAVVDNSGHATILDDDGPPTLSITSSHSQLEGNSGTTSMPLLWVLTTGNHTQPSGKTITFQFDTGDIAGGAHGGTCGGNGIDYEATHKTVTIPAGSRVGSVSVKICGDTAVEAAEPFNYFTSNITNALIGNRLGTGTILNDDGAALSVLSVGTTEGNSGQHVATITVKFPSPAPNPGSLRFSLSGAAVRGNGTDCTKAPAGTDYLPSTTSPVSFGTAAHGVVLRFIICGDQQFEHDDPITVTVTSADWFGPGATGNLTIVNDDPLPG